MDNELPFAVFVVVELKPNIFAATTRAADRGEAGKIGLPGGKVDPGEDPITAVLRESKEEGWLIEGINPNPIKKDYVEGKMVWWFKAKNATVLSVFKEKGRIKPVTANRETISNSGYGNEFISSFSENYKLNNKILRMFLESNQQTNVPQYWFRGTPEQPKNLREVTFSSFARWEGAKPDPIKKEVPPLVEDLYNKGKIDYLSYADPYSAKWKISRKYSGMSNFGFGIYFSNDINWALRYGNWITAVKIDPSNILHIDWSDREQEGTDANKLYTAINSISDRMSEQASHFFRVVKKIGGKDKKALFVTSHGSSEGQLVAYKSDIITPLCFFELEGN